MNGVTRIGCQSLINQNLLNSRKVVCFKGDDDKVESGTKKSSEEKVVVKPKINAVNAGRQLVLGFISPVTSIFSSVKNVAVAAGSVAILSKLVEVTKGKIAPLITIAGLGMGVYEVGTGVYKAVKKEDAHEKEKAFHDIGTGLSITLLSAMSARPFLKQAGVAKVGEVAIDDAGMINSTVECFKQSPKLTKECLSMLDDTTKLAELAAAKSGEASVASAASGSVSQRAAENRIVGVFEKFTTGATGNEAVEEASN